MCQHRNPADRSDRSNPHSLRRRGLNCHARQTMLLMLITMLAGTAAVGDEPRTPESWVTLTGRIRVSGSVPERRPLDITRDEDFCGPFDLSDESLVVNSETGGLANAAIWLVSKKPVPVHESYTARAEEPAVIDNRGCRFVPRIVPLRVGQTLQAVNSDAVSHNVAIYAVRNTPVSIIVPQDEPLERTFDRSELLPVRVDCSIHAWMRAYLIITDHPYACVTDSDGRFTMSNIPAGEYEFAFWHERAGYLEKQKINGETQTFRRGRRTIRLSGEVVDLGDITIDIADLTK